MQRRVRGWVRGGGGGLTPKLSAHSKPMKAPGGPPAGCWVGPPSPPPPPGRVALGIRKSPDSTAYSTQSSRPTKKKKRSKPLKFIKTYETVLSGYSNISFRSSHRWNIVSGKKNNRRKTMHNESHRVGVRGSRINRSIHGLYKLIN